MSLWCRSLSARAGMKVYAVSRFDWSPSLKDPEDVGELVVEMSEPE